MSEVIDIKPTEIFTPSKWEKTSFDHNDLWEAFQRGEKYQKEKQREQFRAEMSKNINKAAVLSENIFNTAINDYDVNVFRAFLKADSLHNFDVLFLVSPEDYISEKFKDIYVKSHLIKSEFNDNSFHVSFKFMPNSKDVNLDCIYSDGYMFAYGKGNGIS
jgi:hypothetical protein